MLGTLVASLVAGEAAVAARRAVTTAIAWAIALVAFLACGGFLVGAGYMWLSRQTGPIIAALIIAGVFAVVGLVVLVLNRVSAGSAVKRAKRERGSDVKALAATAAVAALPALIRSPRSFGMLLVPAAAAAAWFVMRENSGTHLRRDPRRRL